MPVLVEAISVIVKASAIETKFPGGWEGFTGFVPNQTLCADGDLVRLGFMSPEATKAFIGELEDVGLRYLSGGKALDLVVADQRRGLACPCEWAEFGRSPWQGDSQREVSAVRMPGTQSDELVTPQDWLYEGSLSEKSTFIENGHVPEFLDYLRTENGLNVYRDLRTGKEVFIPHS